MKNLILLVGLLSTSAWAVPMLGRDDFYKTFQCKKQIEEQISRWSGTENWKGRIKPDASLMLLKKTSQLSKWISLEKDQSGETLKLLTPVNQMVVSFDSKCIKRIGVQKVKNYQAKNGFTDANLALLLSKNEKGIIYTWSPGMNHSVKALKDILALGEELKVDVTLLVDPYANVNVVKNLLKKNKISYPISQIKKVSSMELILRDTLMHYPNVQFYKNGRMVDVLIPGRMDKAGYAVPASKYLGIAL